MGIRIDEMTDEHGVEARGTAALSRFYYVQESPLDWFIPGGVWGECVRKKLGNEKYFEKYSKWLV